jgi:hypothetical protein
MGGLAFDDAFWGQQLWETALGISFCGEHLVIWEELRIFNWY